MKTAAERLACALPEQVDGIAVDAALITSEINQFYLTGFPFTDGLVLVLRDVVYLLTDFRYAEAARAQAADCEVVCFPAQRCMETLQALLRQHGVKGILLEQQNVSLAQAKRLREVFQQTGASSIEDETLDHLIISLRSVKTEEELQKIRDAQAITDAAFAHILPFIKEGVTEREIALEIEFFMRRQGAQGVAFELIVVSGKNGSLCHGVPSKKQVEKGDLVTMDTGALLNGYHSDMTRTVAVGSISAEQRRAYDLVLKAQLAAIAAVRPGVACGDVDKAARDILEAEYKGAFEHSTGHGVGVEIHEWPRFAAGVKTIVKPGMVVTVEPGVYFPGKFGLRIEDMVAVTENGCEVLTHSPKELIEL